MSTSPDQQEERKSRDEEYWAQPVSELKAGHSPEGALNVNLEGRQVVGPLQGFGRLWQKTYAVRLSGASASPKEVIKTWKEEFPQFWPKGNQFYAPLTGIAPGEVAVINMSPAAGMKLSTGVMVIYADDESFTFMTPQGHVFSGWITFSAEESDGTTLAQTQLLVRANDPLYEIGFRLGGSKAEDKFWEQTLESLARRFGVEAHVQLTASCVDPLLQWSQARNIWHNAAIRTGIYIGMTPLRWARGLFGGG